MAFFEMFGGELIKGMFGGGEAKSASPMPSPIELITRSSSGGSFSPEFGNMTVSRNKPLIDLENPIHVVVVAGLLVGGLIVYKKVK